MGRGPGRPEHLLVELAAPEGDGAEARIQQQRQAIARLEALQDGMGRAMVSWAAPEVRRDPAALLAERDALERDGAPLPDLTRFLRVRCNLPFGPRDLLDAWGAEAPPRIVPCRDPAERDPPEGAIKELARIPGEVIWQPNLGEPPGGMAVFDSAPWPAQAGHGVKLAFLAPGYQRAHPDYRHLEVRELRPTHRHDRGLGTWTLGVLFAQPIHAGLVGVCPRAEPVFVRPWSQRGGGNIHSCADAIDLACTALAPGDVLLLAHTGLALPAELDLAAFAAIQLATARGIHVVEAAGDAPHDLDQHDHGGAFDPALRDSGAILVTGYMRHPLPPPTTGTRIRGARGRRVDLHAPSPIYTVKPTGTDRHLVQWFQGSTSAATQVAGVVAVASGVERQRTGRPVPPARMRALLKATGTPAMLEADLPVAGVQPDLGRLLKALESEGY